MPPASNMRKSSTTTTTATEQHAAHASLNALFQPSRRSTSGRAIRVNTTRPTNYYARPFGSLSAAPDNDASMADASDTHPQGFFPGLQYFTDAITAMPKEVMKQFTLMKEVEAKIHGPNEHLGKLIDELLREPVPRQKVAGSASAAGQGLLSFTAHNSISGSTNASVVNGVAGQPDAQASVNGSVDGEEHVESQEEIARRMQYIELCKGLKSLIPNLDEKHGVLEEANRVLALQELRIDTAMPHVESELSEEARLGSMTHWAYSDNRQKRQVASTASRRDVASTNTLAAAANLIHEHEISNARRDAGKEAMREKTKGKRVEHPGDSDFDEKPKKQKSSKARAAAANAALLANLAGPSSLGTVANGEPANKRKKPAEKGAAATGMERTVSASGRTPKIPKDIPRSMPAADQSVKKAPRAKQVPTQPLTKRKAPGSAQASPMLASSPLASSFVPPAAETPPMSRPQSSRLRHNGVGATNLRHEKTHDDEVVQQPTPTVEKAPIATIFDDAEQATIPRIKDSQNITGTLVNDAVSNIEESRKIPSAAPDVNPPEHISVDTRNTVEKSNVRRNPPESIRQSMEDPTTQQKVEQSATETTEKMKREDIDMPDVLADSRPVGSQSGSASHKTSGRGSAAGTPRTESFPALDGTAMLRTRSTRSKPNARGEDRDSSSTEPGPNDARKHRRVASNSHLVKQLAPFNRSPDLDRHRSRDDMDEDLDSNEEKPSEAEEPKVNELEKDTEPDLERSTRRASARRPISRRNTGPLRATPSGRSRASTPEAPVSSIAKSPPHAPPSTRQQRSTQSAFQRVAQPVPPPPPPAEDEDEDDSEHDPDDPNEPKYCYCNRGSYGEMVACDNDECPREWFHLGCTELREAPGEEEVWYCRECRPKFARKVKGRSARGG